MAIPRARKAGLAHRLPLVSDLTKEIAVKYGVLLEKPGIALRGLFIIDKEGKLRHITVNDLPLGRNVDEILRVLDAVQFNEKHGEVCPRTGKRRKGMRPLKRGLRITRARNSSNGLYSSGQARFSKGRQKGGLDMQIHGQGHAMNAAQRTGTKAAAGSIQSP